VVLDKTLESPLDCKETTPVNPKGNQPEYSSKGLMLKLQYFGHLMQRANSLEQTPMLGKTTLTMQTFVSKVMSLLFNILFRFVKTFLSRSKCLLISWLQSPSALICSPIKYNLSLFPLFLLLFMFKIYLFFQLKDNCFIMLCWFCQTST